MGLICVKKIRSRLGHAWAPLSFFSSRRNWDSPTPWAAGECAPPPFGPGGGHTRLRERGWGNPNSDEGTHTVVHCISKYFVPTPFPFSQSFSIPLPIFQSQSCKILRCVNSLLPSCRYSTFSPYYWTVICCDGPFKAREETMPPTPQNSRSLFFFADIGLTLLM